MNIVATLIKHCLTGIDGESYDVARVVLFFGGLAFIAYAGYSVVTSGKFDPQGYGLGLGGILGGGGFGIASKAKTEPGE